MSAPSIVQSQTVTDYLIIGAGAMGVAFADEIFTRNPKDQITIVDRRESLGGHWNDAYPYVRLHQPAAFYGVNSLALGKGGKDLSSKGEILSYYKKILDKFEASGRVQFLGKHNYLGNNQVAPINDPENIFEYQVNKKVVDATYMKVEIPATHPPKFVVDTGVPFVALNDLVTQYDQWKQFYVVGNGKTGMDAVLFLLNSGIDQNNIYWITPNDSWLFNRSSLQAGTVSKELLHHGDYIKNTQKADDVFLAIEKEGGILRIDKKSLPTKWRCATVSPDELEQLQKLNNIIRKGRIERITPHEIQLQLGNVSYPENSLFVNCSANGLAKREKRPIFSKGLITLQSILFCQQVFSAAAIARLEISPLSDKRRNKIAPIPHPEFQEDWPTIFTATIENLLLCHRYFPLWMFNSRLNFMSHESPLQYIKYSLKAMFLLPQLQKAIRKTERQKA